MAKKQAKAKVQHYAKPEPCPIFDRGRDFGPASAIGGTIISDANGRLWVIDKGVGRPVKFFNE